MYSFEETLKQTGIVLPEVPAPAGMYQPALRIGDFIYTSGQLPMAGGKLVEPEGRGAVTIERQEMAAAAARTAAINAVAAVRSMAGSLDEIERIVKLTVFVSSAPGFTNQHLVANGASALIGEIFGEAGRHVRSAVGVAALPLDASVEVELIAACRQH
ncbi:MAG: RidA family protein [Chlorobiaceae bacterium]|nr:RidA family protein [Chlorobiales bacterium]NTU92078.1 RidA family protein [Chlorobiaceae bacterium]NTV27027.1 RidA family protein [Chlorobiaceae bacterium]